MYGIIYKATAPDGRVYVGQTTKSLKIRKADHACMRKKRDRRTSFQIALLEHSVSAFVWEQIDTAESREELDEKERLYIAHYKATDPVYGYNNTYGGIICKRSNSYLRNRKLSEEHCRKISETKKGHVVSEEHRKKVSVSLKKYYQTPEARHKNSESQKGKKMSAETRQKMSNAKKGQVVSVETRRKISESKKEKNKSTVHRQKLSIARAKISEAVARMIKADLKAGMRNCDVQKKYSVTKGTVRDIKHGRSWAWLEVV